MKPIGLYIHIPFCKGKCPYCDFYSVTPHGSVIEDYTAEVCRRLSAETRIFDTVYFGGGTPSLLGAENICRILGSVNAADGCEMTLECNPSDTGGRDSNFDFKAVADAGIDRISMGLQSSSDSERRFLGRRAGADDAERAVERANAAGIDNISLDLMLGLAGQSTESVGRSIEFCRRLGAKHLSAYLLKLEQVTPAETSFICPMRTRPPNYIFSPSQRRRKTAFCSTKFPTFRSPDMRAATILSIGAVRNTSASVRRRIPSSAASVSIMNAALPISSRASRRSTTATAAMRRNS